MGAEKDFENKIKKFLKDNDIFYVKFFANAYTPSGVPDILACHNGNFLGIEVKAEGGKVSELQKVKLNEIAEAGGGAVVVFPSGFELFKKYIKGGYCYKYSLNIFKHANIEHTL